MECISLHEIGDQGLDVAGEVTAEGYDALLGEAEGAFESASPGQYTLHLHRVGEVIRVKGSAAFCLKTACARCLASVDVSIQIPIEVSLFPQGHEPEAGPDGELTDEDMGVSCYENDNIDLTALLRDELLLQLPMAVLCHHDCKGLCAVCGNNRNDRGCVCAPVVDPRFSALAALAGKTAS